MQLFRKPLPSTEMVRASSQSSCSQSAISTSDWCSIWALVSEVVTGIHGIHDKKVQKLNNSILGLTTEIALLRSQNNGYKQAIFGEKKKRKRGRGFFEGVRAQDGQGATFFSPRKIKAAKDLLTQKEHAEEQEQRDRVAQKKARKRLQQQQQQQAEKEVRKVERAQKASQRKEEVALQTRQRQLAKDARITANSFNPSREEPLQKLKRPTKRIKHSPEPVMALHTPSSQRATIQPVTRAGRITRRPNHPSDYHIDI
jgi:phage-related minor tail protein